MNIRPTQLQRYIRSSRIILQGSDRAEVRSLSFMLIAVILYQLCQPAAYILLVPESVTHRVANLVSGIGIAGAFLLSAGMLLPHLIALAFFPKSLGCRWPRKMAACAGFIGAFMWGALGYISAPLDYEWVTIVFVVNSLFDLWIAVLLGISLNAQQARAHAADLHRRLNAQGFGGSTDDGA